MLKEPVWGPVGKEVYDRTYSRPLADGSMETWADTVKRVIRGNLGLVDTKFHEPNESEKLFDLMYNFKIVPGGRHLWSSGVEGRQFLFNCHRAPFEKRMSAHYKFIFDQLMQGGGVGTNYSNRYIDIIPKLTSTVDLRIVCREDHPDYNEFKDLVEFNGFDWDLMLDDNYLSIDDSREGWVEGLAATIDDHFLQESTTLYLDVSCVRERGAKINGFGGTASGPAALVQMLLAVNDLMNKSVGSQLCSLDHMQIDHEIAMCVVAGNVRRSARMSLKSWKDSDILDFIHCKGEDKSNHWTTNISVEIDDDFIHRVRMGEQHATEIYLETIKGMLRDGEPGFFNITLASVGENGDVGSTNPCGEIALEPYENCNLGHINLAKFVNDERNAREAFRLMTRFLMRATFGDIPNPLQRAVVDRNRRIGVGFFGYQGWLVQQGIKFSESHSDAKVISTLKFFKMVIDDEAVKYARQLRIPVPIKTSTLAPTGSIAKLSGDTEGLQTTYSPYVIRNIRYASDDPRIDQFIADGYKVEDCIYNPNTKVVSFYYKDPLCELALNESLVEGAADVSLEDFLAVQAMVQEHYADNAISFTINVEPDKYSVEDAAKIFIKYLDKIKGTTIMPDGTRPQSPYIRISKAEYELAEYVKTMGSGELACSVNGCPVK